MTKEEAIRKLQKQKAEYLEEWIDYSGVAEAFDMAIEALSAERTGTWISDWNRKIKMIDGCPDGSCHCSCCGEWLVASDEYEVKGIYCPNCGAKMVEGEKE